MERFIRHSFVIHKKKYNLTFFFDTQEEKKMANSKAATPNYLSEFGSYIGLSDVMGRLAPPIDRYHKMKFKCQHCFRQVEDYCVG
jgi:hypothetical protein